MSHCIYKYYFLSKLKDISKMIRFTQYLHRIKKYDDAYKRIINVFKRLNDLMTDNKKNYDDFNFLIKNKEKIRTWLLNNLATSSVVLIALH